MTTTQQQITERVKTLIEQNTQAKIAKQLGISEGYVNYIKNGKWESISDALTNRLKVHFRLDGWKTLATPNYLTMKNLYADVKVHHRFIGISAFTGAGKTTAFMKFTSEDPEGYYVLGDVLMNQVSFLQAIQQAIGISDGSTKAALMKAIVERLLSEDNPVIVIDDAGKLSDACFRLLQVIYDRTEGNVGFIIAGTEYLKRNLDRGAQKDKMGFRELKRRIAYWQPLHRPKDNIVAEICQKYNITDKKVLAWICKKTEDYGTLRNIIENLLRAADGDGQAVTMEIATRIAVGDWDN